MLHQEESLAGGFVVVFPFVLFDGLGMFGPITVYNPSCLVVWEPISPL